MVEVVTEERPSDRDPVGRAAVVDVFVVLVVAVVDDDVVLDVEVELVDPEVVVEVAGGTVTVVVAVEVAVDVVGVLAVVRVFAVVLAAAIVSVVLVEVVSRHTPLITETVQSPVEADAALGSPSATTAMIAPTTESM